jgi:hypothetical protein
MHYVAEDITPWVAWCTWEYSAQLWGLWLAACAQYPPWQ